MIIGVKYCSETTGELSSREYSYRCELDVDLGEIIDVPARGKYAKAIVTRLNIPEAEIESFKDSVLTITNKQRPVFNTED